MTVSTPNRRSIADWSEAVLLVVVVATIYLQVVHDDFIAFDDGRYVHNPWVIGGLRWKSFVWAWTNLDAAGYYHPFTWLSHLLDIGLFGPRPGWMALENAALHTVNAWLVARLLFALGCSRPAALFGALAFAAHPLNVEAVAWISQRKTMLAALFGLTALLVYLRRAQRRQRPVNWAVILGLAASLLSKPWLVVFPAWLLVLDWWPLGRFAVENEPAGTVEGGQNFRRSWWLLCCEKWPLLALSVVAAIIAILAQHSGGAVVPLRRMPLGLRIENAAVSVVDYLADVFRIGDHALLYSHPLSLPLATVLIAMGVIAAVTGLAIGLARRDGALLAGWSWFLLALLPVIGLVQVGYQARADRFMYLPIIGILWVGAHLGDVAWRSLHQSRRWTLLVAGALWIALLGGAAFRQARFWRNTFGIAGHSIRVAGATPELLSLLATACLQIGQPGQAVSIMEKAMQVEPVEVRTILNYAFALFKAGRTREAIGAAEQVLAREPDNFTAHSDLMTFYQASGRPDLAAPHAAFVQRGHGDLSPDQAPLPDKPAQP
jgi:hypothetical protein